MRASLSHTTQAAAQAVEGAREVVFCYPPSSPFVILAAFDADQLSVPWRIIPASFAVREFCLGHKLTRAKSLVSIFVTRRRLLVSPAVGS